MQVTHPANYEFSFYDAQGDMLRSGRLSQEELDGRKASANQQWTESAQADVDVISEYEIDKPTWFVSAEQSAVRFMSELGLQACQGSQITLVDVTTFEDAQRVFANETKETSIDAESSPYYGVVMRLDRAESAFRSRGESAVAHTLVHELTHTAEWVKPQLSEVWDKQTKDWIQTSRQGHMVIKGDIITGQFLSEGIPEFNAGLFARRDAQPDCPVISIDGRPSLELPAHYEDFRPVREIPYTAGPDGYSIELLAWGAQEKGISSADVCIAAAHATFSLDPAERKRGFRSFDAIINAIRPGLVGELRQLQYGRQDWQNGLKLVHEAVTA